MKRFFALLLAALLMLSMTACDKIQEKEIADTNLQLGYGRACITPETSVPLNGYNSGDSRMSTEVLDDIYVTCIAMSDGTHEALLFSQDLFISTATLTPKLRSALTDALGVSGAYIFFAATANYSAPNLKSSHKRMEGYLELYKAAVIQAAQDALADLAPTTLSSASIDVEGMSYTHHYTMEDGTVEDGYYGFFDREITGHAAEPDTTMRLIKARRKDKEDIVLISWQCRPTLTGGKDKTVISADFIGYLRNKVEAETGAKPIYFTGGYGEISPTSLIESEDHGLDVKAYGEKLADYALEALFGEMTPITDGKSVGVYTISNYAFELNHTEQDREEDAKEVVALRKEQGYEVADKLAKEMGFRSVYHAGSIANRSGRKEQEKIEISALRFGELGFLMMPMGVFSTTAEQAIENGATEATLVLTQANAAWNTIPSQEAFAYGGYEVDASYFAPGEAERALKDLNDMLLMTTDD